MKNIITRTITGILFVGIIISSIFFGPYTFWALFTIITGLTLCEFYKLIIKTNSASLSNIIDLIGGMYLFSALFLFASDITRLTTIQIFSPYLVYLLYTFISQLYTKKESPIRNWAYTILGQVYIALPLGLLSMIAYHAQPLYSTELLVAFFCFIWINDTGAFVVGSTLGKHRLFERISPKKSWEGFFGGVAFSLITAFLFSLLSENLTLCQWLGLGLSISVFATWGDLCESLLKRSIHIKDSGAILPGHGGMLDRFDSVLLAAPATVIYLALFV